MELVLWKVGEVGLHGHLQLDLLGHPVSRKVSESCVFEARVDGHHHLEGFRLGGLSLFLYRD